MYKKWYNIKFSIQLVYGDEIYVLCACIDIHVVTVTRMSEEPHGGWSRKKESFAEGFPCVSV